MLSNISSHEYAEPEQVEDEVLQVQPTMAPQVLLVPGLGHVSGVPAQESWFHLQPTVVQSDWVECMPQAEGVPVHVLPDVSPLVPPVAEPPFPVIPPMVSEPPEPPLDSPPVALTPPEPGAPAVPPLADTPPDPEAPSVPGKVTFELEAHAPAKNTSTAMAELRRIDVIEFTLLESDPKLSTHALRTKGGENEIEIALSAYHRL